jgi:hypothetical protein
MSLLANIVERAVMTTAVRPWVTSGIALVGASVIAVTPIASPPQALAPQALAPQVHIPEVQMPAVQLTAQVIDIFRFPAARQWIVNQIDDLVTLGSDWEDPQSLWEMRSSRFPE